MSNHIGQAFHARRLELGEPACAVAERAGIKDDHLRRIERGLQNPRWDTMQLIAGALGCELVPTLKPKESEVSE